jgi:hypothetical protein
MLEFRSTFVLFKVPEYKVMKYPIPILYKKAEAIICRFRFLIRTSGHMVDIIIKLIKTIEKYLA